MKIIAAKIISKKHGQVFSLDFIFATVVFIVILVLAASAWNSLGGKIIYVRSMRDMSTISASAVSALVDTEGIPSDWNKHTNLNISKVIPGISSAEPGIIDEAKANKILQLGNTSYDDLKTALGIVGADYDFIIQIGDNTTGRYKNTSKDVFGIDRLMEYENGTIVEVKLRVWH